MLLNFTYYAQYYAQEQELWSEYYAIYVQVYINKLLLVVDNIRKTVLLECIMNGIKVYVPLRSITR